jgi:hypothetical protein
MQMAEYHWPCKHVDLPKTCTLRPCTPAAAGQHTAIVIHESSLPGHASVPLLPAGGVGSGPLP